ncbi:MAG: ExeM/NucH family extracellular endonuclease [Anaerolineae bacterium]|nr:ExeM/NucH family extracellular endonuclease [Anaerolineae bacterium]
MNPGQNPKQRIRIFIIILITIAILVGASSPAQAAFPDVFINELHYDNASTDVGEAIEVAGPAGTDLSGWNIALYNGSATQLNVYRVIGLAGIIPDQEDGCGTISFSQSGIQNGAPDGMALLDPSNTVVQFLSYEGVFTAASGPAAGMTSSDIGVSESSATPVGSSLQLSGSGSVYGDFTWAPAAANSFGAVNGSQTFTCGGGGGPEPTPTPSPEPPPDVDIVINEVDADQTGTDTAEFVELFDGGAGNTDLSGLVLVFFNGNGDSSYKAFDLDGYSTSSSGYFVLCGNAATVANCDLDVSPDSNLIQNGADAVALYFGSDSDFPYGTAVTTTGLIDALVYDTFDSDDGGLLVLLNAGQPQINEGESGDQNNHSNQRCENGSGGQRNTDSYTQNNPSPGEENNCGGEVDTFGACYDPATLIHDIQGNGSASPLNGASGIVVEGVVVGDYQNTVTGLRGFFVQEEDGEADGDLATSEGLFVFDNGFGIDVNAGDLVRVQGNVTEYYNLTELNNISNVAVCSRGNTVTAATVLLPVSNLGDWEPYEGMLLNIPQTLTVTENYSLGRYGQVELSLGRLFNPTHITNPGAAANAQQDLNDRSRITLDDGNNQQNIDPTLYPAPGLNASNTLRSGYTVNGLTGVLDYAFGAYRIQPVGAISFTAANPRTNAPAAVGGTLKTASFNVLNYFNGDGQGGGFPTARGADSQSEFNRQRIKIINAILAIDADIIGLMEIENDGYGPYSAIQDLVDGLNVAAGDGTYAFIDPGVPQIGLDEITVGLIYKPAKVTPVGITGILDSSVDPLFNDGKNRPALAQTFLQIGNGERLTIVVNHFKSKGSDCNSLGDPDTGDGQGNCNQTRTNAANALTAWLTTDPTGSGDPDTLIIGDLNAYAKEDPIMAILSAGFTNLLEALLGPAAYSYIFDGQAGYLDHALANASLAPQVTGATIWHINADEPIALDYNEEFKSPGQILNFYSPNPNRASDHDPVVVGFCLDRTAPVLDIQLTPDTIKTPNHKYTVINAFVDILDGDPNVSLTLLSVTSNEPDNGLGDGDMPNDIIILSDNTFLVRAERSGTGDGRVYTVTYQATDSCDNTTIASATVTVPHSQGVGNR